MQNSGAVCASVQLYARSPTFHGWVCPHRERVVQYTYYMSGEEHPYSLSQGPEHDRRRIQPEHIPPELMPHPQWVCWRYVDRGEGRKPDKQPVNPRSLANAGVHWANTCV